MYSYGKKMIFNLLIIVLFSTFPLKADIVIEKNTPVSIIISENASETEYFAATELQKYINLINGISIPVIKDAKVDITSVRIYIGKSKYTEQYLSQFDRSVTGPGQDSFFIKARDGQIVLVGGGDRGTLYSVYEFLEQQGCRWFMPGKLGEVIPRKEKIVIKEGEKLYVPNFIQREITIGGGDNISVEEIIDWCAKNKINRIFNIGSRRKEYYQFWEKRGGDLKWQHICHNYIFILPNEKYFKEHPEYYALYKGQRVELGNEKGNVCTTNPDVIRIFTDFVIDWFDKNPDGAVFPISPPDGLIRWCECPECQKLGGINFMPGEKGSMSRRQIVFLNEIAKRVYEKHPDRYLLLLAYQNTVDPVPDLKLEKNVIVQVAHHGCLVHGIDKCEENKKMKERFEGWAKIAHPLSGSPGIWDYFLLQVDGMSGSPYAPLPFATTAKDNIRYLKKLGGKYYFTQAGPVQIYNPLPFYVIAKLTWDTKMDFEKLCDDFFEKFYGESCKPMKGYWMLLENAVQKSDWHCTKWQDLTLPSPKVFTPEVLQKAEKYLEEAERIAKNEIIKQRIGLVRKSFEYVKSIVGQKKEWRLKREKDYYEINTEGTPEDEDFLKKLIVQGEQYGDPDGSIKRMIFRIKKRKEPVINLENERILVSVIPGIGGRIIRLVDKKTGINYMREPLEENYLSDIGSFYFDYGGYEEYIGKQFASPGWEEEFQYSIVENDRQKRIILTTDIQDFNLERTISIEKGTSPEISIQSKLTYKGTSSKKTKLRIHPEMEIKKGNTENIYIWYQTKEGIFRRINLSNILTEQPYDTWAAIDEKENIGIVNYFEPENVECYLFYNPEKGFFNMELMSFEKELKNGESIIISHRYKLLEDAKKEFLKQESISDNLDNTLIEVEKLSGTIKFGEGIVNKSAVFEGKEYLHYDAKNTIKGNAGTIEMWIKPYKDAEEIEFEPLISIGNNAPSWFLISLNKGTLGFLYKKGQKPFQKEEEFYSNLSVNIKNWKKMEWHHIGIVWANLERAKSIVQIYIDGELKESRYNMNIGEDLEGDVLGIGCNTAGMLSPRFCGEIDELRISNHPKTKKEIFESYEQGKRKEPLTADDGTLLLLNFDGKITTGISKSIEKISKEKIRFYVEELLKD